MYITTIKYFSVVLQGNDLNRLLRIDTTSGSDDFALDIRHGAVQVGWDLSSSVFP